MPFNIEPFDNIGGPLDAFRVSVQARLDQCGSQCLTVQENISGDTLDPTQCIVDDIVYDPEPGPAQAAEEDRKLRAGTVVSAQVSCPEPSGTSTDAPTQG